MTEQERAEGGSKKWHPIIRLIIENPISALNTAMILFGGGMVYASNEARMAKLADRVDAVERLRIEDRAAASVSVATATQEVRTLTRDLGDVKVTVRGIETAVQFLVQQARDQQQRPSQRGPQ